MNSMQTAPSYLEYQANKAKLPAYAARVKAYRSEWQANKSLAAKRK
jgi:hypothetical protein